MKKILSRKLPWLAWIIAAVVVLALLGGGWFGARRLLAWRAARRTAAVSAAPSPAPSGGPQQTADAPASANNATSIPDVQDAIPVAPAAAKDSASASAPNSPANDLMEWKIQAGKRTKVTIVADNDMVFDGTMKAGENHFLSAADHFQVSAKDTGELHIELNEKTLAPIGPPGHAGKVTLTRDTLKGASSGGN